MSAERFDATARRFHQWAIVTLVVAGYIFGNAVGFWLVAVAAFVMFVGRFWWPADVFRQVAWRWLEPGGILRRDDVAEDHETRRIARVLGGLVFGISAALIAADPEIAVLGWVFSGLIAVMVFLDAAFDF